MVESQQKYAPLSDATRVKLAHYEDLMGKRPDGEIAKAAGLDRRYVVVYRHFAGIPPFQRTSRGDAAEASGAGTRRGSFRRSRLDVYRHLMGEVPDGRIAELAGCSREAVMRYRSRHDISPASRGAHPAMAPVAPDAPSGPHDLPPEMDDLVLSKPSHLSEPSPASEPSLLSAPSLANVVVMKRGQRDPAVSAVSAVAGHNGYLVTAQIDGEQHTYLIVGSDIALAARRAMQLLARISPDASILELNYHAEMLG